VSVRFLRIVALTLLLVVGASPAGAAVPAAQPVAPTPATGAVFLPSVLGLGPVLHLPHTCSGSVLHSSSRDLVITAAHCVYGNGLAMEFAPGYVDGRTPYGVWAVRRVYVDPQWRHGQDPRYDVAILQLAAHGALRVEDRTGPAPLLGTAPAAGSSVDVTGYKLGSGGGPIGCSAPVYYTAGYPSFDCTGFTAGVSGGPWLQDGHIVGVIGGLEQGGCSPATTYSAPFGGAVAALLVRAEAGGAGDSGPITLPDC
jgi:hypothetical protein